MPNGLVYIVSHGEKHEGSTVVAVCDNHSRALEVALYEINKMRRIWQSVDSTKDESVVDSDVYKPNPNVRTWSLSCDYVQIQTMTINHYPKGE